MKHKKHVFYPSQLNLMVQKYKKYPKYFFDSKKSCTFAPAFRRNRWQEVSRGLLCCVGTIQQFNYLKVQWI